MNTKRSNGPMSKRLHQLFFILIMVILLITATMVITPATSPGYANEGSSNQWTYTGELSNAHWGATATLLQNGQVLVAGGAGISGLTTDAELYDPTTGIWTLTGSMNTAREFHTATLLPDGRVLVAGGHFPDQQAFSSAELYDPATGTWSYTGSLNQARTEHTATLLPNGKVLVTGGDTGGQNYAISTELYDPSTGIWSFTGSLNESRGAHTATLLRNGKILVAGGYHVNYCIPSAELYDPATGNWSLTGSMNEPRGWHTASLLPDGKVLVAGSNIWGNTFSSSEIYDPNTGIWSYTGSMHESRGDHIAVNLPDGTVLVAGGDGTNNRSAEIYDPSTSAWHYTGSLNDGRGWLNGVFLPDGRVLAVGGENITTSELYDFPLSINLVPSEQSQNGNRGDTIQFIETLSNNTGITETIQLALGGSQWPAVLSGDSISLGSGEQATFTVDVTIPADAEWGMLNTIVVTATSSVSPTVYFDTALLNVQVSPRPSSLLYLPMVIRPPEVIPGLTGKVTMNGAPIAGIALDLRFYNGSSYSTYASTTTGADGSYLFSGVPALQPGQNYYVRYNNDENNDTRLTTWHTADNTTYNATSLVAFADFDIANIVLTAPEPGATVETPVTFRWIPRPASPSDSYALEIFDLSNDAPYFFTDPYLGYVGSYTLEERPDGFEKGVEYGWGIYVESPEGGFGYSYYYYSITFE